MKTATHWMLMVVLGFAGMMASPVPAHAGFTLSVSCALNPVPPPGRPYMNVDCTATWSGVDDGSGFANADFTGNAAYVSPTGDRTWFGNVDFGLYYLPNTTPPLSSYLACAWPSNNEFENLLEAQPYVWEYHGPGFPQQGWFLEISGLPTVNSEQVFVTSGVPCP